MIFDKAKVSPNEVIFAIGDIHGRLDLLEEKIRAIKLKMNEFDDKYSFHLVFLGDYIDRGRESCQVIEKLMSLEISNCTMHYLMGNHEDILLKFLSNPSKYHKRWMAIGGAATLTSFGIDGANDPQMIKQDMLKQMGVKMLGFLNDLKFSYTNADYFFCHAIPRTDQPLAQQSKNTLVNNRKVDTPDYEKIVIHGHVSGDRVKFLGSKINIDTRAYATENLTCLLVNNHSQIIL